VPAHSVEDVRVESWAELDGALYAGAWDESLRRFRSTCAFRGMGSSSHDLRTALMRHVQIQPTLERDLLRAFRKYAFRDAGWDSVWHWLALAQHHGLPTRLLDWTYSPLVAMHFATANPLYADQDGVIWCADYSVTNQVLPEPVRDALSAEGAGVFTAEMLASVAASLARFDRLSDEPFVVFFEPPSLDDRIINQFALFSLMSSPLARLDHWLDRHPGAGRRIVIPARLKREVRDKLDQANVTERVLFPGLDGLCRWLRRYYDPSPYRASQVDTMHSADGLPPEPT